MAEWETVPAGRCPAGDLVPYRHEHRNSFTPRASASCLGSARAQWSPGTSISIGGVTLD